jgi:hypothetical protein
MRESVSPAVTATAEQASISGIAAIDLRLRQRYPGSQRTDVR